MKIEKINDNKIRCTLTHEDLHQRHLTMNELSSGSEKVKELFREIILEAENRFGFKPKNMQLMVEALPSPPDGIVLIITHIDNPEELREHLARSTPHINVELGPTRAPEGTGADDILNKFYQPNGENRKKSPKDMFRTASGESSSNEDTVLTQMYLFPTLDSVIEVAKSLNGFYNGTNTLYKEKNQPYTLVVHQEGISPEKFNRVCNILSEYGARKSCPPSREAHLKEHAEVIISNYALQHLLLIS